MSDFEAIEEDVLYIIHQVTVSHEVHDTLLILSRMNKNKMDRKLREKYRLIQQHQSEFFPLEVISNQDHEEVPLKHSLIGQHFKVDHVNHKKKSFHENPIFDEIVNKAKVKGEKPFKTAIK